MGKKRRAENIDPGFLASGPRWEHPAFFVVIAAWAVLVLWTHYKTLTLRPLDLAFWARFFPPLWKIPFPVFAKHLGYLLAHGLFFALSALLGRGILKRFFRIDGLNSIETAAFGYGLGLSVIGLGTFLLGAVHLLYPAVVFVWAAALLGAAGFLNRDLRDPKPEQGAAPVSGLFRDPGCVPLAVLTALVLLFQAYHAIAPEISFDSLVYHLGLMNLYRLEGGIVATPANLYSGFPMLLEWVYAFLLYFGDEIFAKLAHWGCALGAALSFCGLALRCRRPLAGWLASILFLSVPVLLYNVVRAGVDVGSAFIILLCVHSLAIKFSGERRDVFDGGWALPAVFLGIAFGIKYVNWPLWIAFPILLGLLGTPRPVILRFAALSGGLALPWAIKNVILTRNPVFPFFHGLFVSNPPFPVDWRTLRVDAWGRPWEKLIEGGRPLWELIAHPWYITVRGSTEFDHVGPLLLMLLPLLLWRRPESRETRLWLWALIAIWLCWWPASGMVRFFLPGLALLAFASADALARARPSWLRALLMAAAAALAVDGIMIFSGITSSSDSPAYQIYGMSKEEYLSHSRFTYPSSYYKAARWIGKNTPKDARVLVVGGGRSYYLERPFIANSPLDVDVLTFWLKSSSTPEELSRRFHEAGVSHMLVNLAWLWSRLPDEELAHRHHLVLNAFFRKYARSVFEDMDKKEPRWTRVYEIRPEPGEGTAGEIPLVTWYRLARELKKKP
ncbi:MAG: hypothetical protein V3S11_06375 [Elusimicrobiota bacterium]